MSDTARWTGPGPPQQQQRAQPANGGGGGDGGANLADILERVLDKGIVIAGDIQVNLLDIELLTIKIRLIVASVDRAKEMGIDWWERDPTLSAGRRELEDENKELRARIEALERNGHRGGELASDTADDEPDDIVDEADDIADEPDDVADDEPYAEVVEDVEDVEDVDEVEDIGVEDDHPDEPDEDDGEPDRDDGPADDERPTRGNGRSGRTSRAKAGRDEPASGADADGDGSGRSRNGRGRGRASRDDAGRDGEEREMPARRKPGSKRSSTPRER